MATDKTLLTQVDGLTTKQALKLQFEIAAAKRETAPQAKGQSAIIDTKKLNGKTLKEIAEKGD